MIRTIETLTEAGVLLRSLREGIDYSTATGRMLAGIFAALAAYERELMHERAAAARAAARARGKHTGRPAKLTPKPADLTFEQAATVAISGLTALQGLRDHGRIEPGQEVLVIGASGGVGSFAVQIAKALGARVTGVCSTNKVEMVRSIGADRVIDYSREDFARGEDRYDVILDVAGSSSLTRLRRILTPEGTLVLVGGEAGGRWLGVVARLLRARLLSPFVSQKLRTFLSSENHEDMLVLRELIESGKVIPVIDWTYSLSEVPEAIRYLEEGHVRGKVAITV